LWDDLDSSVIDTSLDLTRYLLVEERYPELVAFASSSNPLASGAAAANNTDSALPPPSGRRASITSAPNVSAAPLMQAISQRLKDPSYTHKHKLNQLLQWFFE
jgi:hypothetical protein